MGSRRFSSAFTSRALDFDLILRWIPPLSLIRWTQSRAAEEPANGQAAQLAPDGTLLLHGLFRPLFYPFQLRIGDDTLFPDHLLPRAVAARRLFNLIRQESWDEAIQLARGRYLAAGRPTVVPPRDIRADGELLAAALLVPIRGHEIVSGLRRWIQPAKQNWK